MPEEDRRHDELIASLEEARSAAARKVQRLLADLETAEQEFEAATRRLEEAKRRRSAA